MSAVTLETLKADFEAKFVERLTYIYDRYEVNPDRRKMTVISPEEFVEESLFLLFGTDEEAFYHIERTYRAAEAVILYKLSDGAIDPREGGDA